MATVLDNWLVGPTWTELLLLTEEVSSVFMAEEDVDTVVLRTPIATTPETRAIAITAAITAEKARLRLELIPVGYQSIVLEQSILNRLSSYLTPLFNKLNKNRG